MKRVDKMLILKPCAWAIKALIRIRLFVWYVLSAKQSLSSIRFLLFDTPVAMKRLRHFWNFVKNFFKPFYCCLHYDKTAYLVKITIWRLNALSLTHFNICDVIGNNILFGKMQFTIYYIVWNSRLQILWRLENCQQL